MPIQSKRRMPPPAPSVQRKLTEEEEPVVRRLSLFRRILWRALAAVLLVAALLFAYLFLLMGEPDEDAKYLEEPVEEVIAMPMSPFEAPGSRNVQNLADAFGEAVLALAEGPAMQKARVYDTALEGSYARRTTLTYAFEDGAQLTVESLRPTAAVTLLAMEGASLDATSLYTIGGLNAARMDTDNMICVFSQSDRAVYAVYCPKSHQSDLDSLLKQTTLVLPAQDEP